MTGVVVVVAEVSAVVPVSGTVVLMVAMAGEGGSLLAERPWREVDAGGAVHTPRLARWAPKMTVVMWVTAASGVSGTVVLMMALGREVGWQVAARGWRELYAGCEVHTPLLAR
jgi:hypothetical protein